MAPGIEQFNDWATFTAVRQPVTSWFLIRRGAIKRLTYFCGELTTNLFLSGSGEVVTKLARKPMYLCMYVLLICFSGF